MIDASAVDEWNLPSILYVAGSGRFAKVGITSNLERRALQLRNHAKGRFRIVRFWSTPHCRGAERIIVHDWKRLAVPGFYEVFETSSAALVRKALRVMRECDAGRMPYRTWSGLIDYN